MLYIRSVPVPRRCEPRARLLAAGLTLILLLFAFSGTGASAEAQMNTVSGSSTLSDPFVPAKAYVLVTGVEERGFLPLPEEEDLVFPFSQVLSDGTCTENVIHLTPEGVYMESSSCADQDCVCQGLVTLENRETRLYGNLILCLSNQVSLELFTPEEILQLYADTAPQG